MLRVALAVLLVSGCTSGAPKAPKDPVVAGRELCVKELSTACRRAAFQEYNEEILVGLMDGSEIVYQCREYGRRVCR